MFKMESRDLLLTDSMLRKFYWQGIITLLIGVALLTAGLVLLFSANKIASGKVGTGVIIFGVIGLLCSLSSYIAAKSRCNKIPQYIWSKYGGANRSLPAKNKIEKQPIKNGYVKNILESAEHFENQQIPSIVLDGV